MTSNSAIPEGSLVVVTGANGYIGSAIADYFLKNGFRVRGTVRSLERAAWVQAYFDKHYPGKFELSPVSNMTAEGSFDEAIKGASAVVHVASEVSFSPNPNDVVPVAIAGALNALKSAYAEPSVKRFVLTSSSSAAVPLPTSGETEPNLIDVDTYNEASVKEAWADPPYEPERAGAVYAASKTQSEQEVWKYYKENKDRRPDLVVNSVLPNNNYGKVLDVKNQGYPSSAGLIHQLYEGQATPVHYIVGNQYHIDIVDDAALHYAAAVLPDVKEERIFAFAEPFTWPLILKILRKHYPDQPIPEDFEAQGIHHTIKPRDRAEELLRRLGHPGWVSLEDSVVATIESGKQQA